ncbi:MAG TPA: hypothetical protein VGM25_06140 [Caulobacteraceae bacterium]|jgi:hypothetical protein
MAIIKALALAAVGMVLAAPLAQAEPQAKAAPRAKAGPAWSPRDFTGVYEGQFLTKLDFPYNEKYGAIFKQRQQDDVDNKPYDDPASHCLTSGMPAMMLSAGYPFEIFQSGRQVTFTKENGSVRRIQMKRGHQGQDDGPLYMGDSIGHWEGNVLVVDTINFRGDTSLERRIAPHSTAMHITERISRPSYGLILDQVTLTDIEAFTRPWVHTVKLTRHDDWELKEFVCDNNRYYLKPDGSSAIKGLAPIPR